MTTNIGIDPGKRQPPVKVALVGHRGTPADEVSKNRCVSLYRALIDLPPGVEFEFDAIDLNEGRDFLLEDKRYDAIILQFVNRQGYTDKPGFEVTSPKSSWSNWRKRLSATGARVVFAYGRDSEVSGVFLERLDGGYTRLHLGGIGDLTIFVKEEPMKSSWQDGA